jgi:HK97 family phage major capsid protein
MTVKTGANNSADYGFTDRRLFLEMAGGKTGARNSADDRVRIRKIREMSEGIVGITKELDPDESEEYARVSEKDLVMLGGQVKALGDGRLGGYLVRFSTAQDPDLTGDYFTARTDFGEAVDSPVLYGHGMDAKMGRRKLGNGELRKDEVGVWIEAQLALRDEYEKAVYQLAEAGKLGWSSGTASHLVERRQAGKAMEITAWPLGLDASLTPTPAEPRNAAMTVKTYCELIGSEGNAEAGGTGAAQEQADLVDDNQPILVKETETMEREDVLKLMAERDAQREAEAKAAKEQAEALQKAEEGGYQKALSELKGARRGGYAYHKEAKAQDDNDGSAAWWHWIKTGDDRLAEMRGFEVKAALDETTGAQGEYLVPDGFNANIREKLHERSVMRAAGATVIPTSLKMVDFPSENGAAAAALTSEAGAYNESEPTFSSTSITVYKGSNLIKVSEELLADSQANLEGFLTNQIVSAQAALENTWFLTGTGTGQPRGAVTLSSAALTTASGTAITAAEFVSLVYALGDRYADNAALFMKRATLGYLRSVAVSNQFAFAPTPSGSPAPRGGTGAENIWGIPVYQSSVLNAIAITNKPILVCDPSQYIILENGGLRVSRNPWLYQANGQVGIFSSFRVGGNAPITEAFYHMLMHA